MALIISCYDLSQSLTKIRRGSAAKGISVAEAGAVQAAAKRRQKPLL